MPKLKINRNYHTAYTATGDSLLIIASFLIFNFLHPYAYDSSHALESSTASSASVAITPNIGVEATDINLDVIPTHDGSWQTGTSTVTVSTNNETGYKLYISSSSEQLDLVNTDDSNYQIENLPSETTETTFKSDTNLVNHYGYTHNNNGTNTEEGQITVGTYLPLTNSNNARLIKTTAELNNESVTTLTFATKVDNELPAGTYTNTITLTAIANEIPESTMQEFTTNDCAALPIWSSTADDFTLKDARDDNTYTIRKLKMSSDSSSAACWMVDNLRLQDYELKPEDSDVSSNFTIPAANNSKWTNTTGADDDIARVIPMVAKSKPDDDTTNIYTDYGMYYSRAAAIASSEDYVTTSENVSSSICPRGWHLPTGSVANSNGEWYQLFNANNDIYGFWWTSTSYNTNNACSAHVSSDGYVNAGTGISYKRNGLSVRCLLPAT